ncbi:hypothetical protein IWX49DRAFT_273775 [Phyllosticta citricarpa]|uniref:Uncharacterized protein n=1 Tax=Phyllosticta citricarpa TaxID=55181 RepID=A0ABR1L970_9PEZI
MPFSLPPREQQDSAQHVCRCRTSEGRAVSSAHQQNVPKTAIRAIAPRCSYQQGSVLFYLPFLRATVFESCRWRDREGGWEDRKEEIFVARSLAALRCARHARLPACPRKGKASKTRGDAHSLHHGCASLRWDPLRLAEVGPSILPPRYSYLHSSLPLSPYLTYLPDPCGWLVGWLVVWLDVVSSRLSGSLSDRSTVRVLLLDWGCDDRHHLIPSSLRRASISGRGGGALDWTSFSLLQSLAVLAGWLAGWLAVAVAVAGSCFPVRGAVPWLCSLCLGAGRR